MSKTIKIEQEMVIKLSGDDLKEFLQIVNECASITDDDVINGNYINLDASDVLIMKRIRDNIIK